MHRRSPSLPKQLSSRQHKGLRKLIRCSTDIMQANFRLQGTGVQKPMKNLLSAVKFARQRSVVCQAAGDRLGKPVFQLDDRQSLNMADIMDAYEVCSLIPDANERHECYSVFGLDAQQMANYYDTVVRLEQQLNSDIDTSAPGVVLSEPDPDDYLHAPAECSWSE